MARKTPTVENNIYTLMDYEHEPPRVIVKLNIASSKDWQYWQKFLEHEKLFRFIYTNKQGFKFTFSARKEQRPSYGRKENLIEVWYAHKRIGGKLRKVYLGVSDNLTQQKLQETALKINQGRLL